MRDLVQRLRDECERLAGHSLEHGYAESGIAANLADEAIEEIERLRRIEELALIWSAYQDDESKANPDLLMPSLDAACRVVEITLDRFCGVR